MKTQDIKQRTGEELNRLLGESRKKMRELRFNLVAGKVKNIREIRKLKIEIARILTILKEKDNQK